MSSWAEVLFWVLVALAAGQAMTVVRFVWTMHRVPQTTVAAPRSPKAAVILCLRGPDPFLATCLEAVLDQDYPRYDLRIVVDSAEDPVLKIVEQVVTRRQATNVLVQPLTARRETCSLKCSSLRQAVSEPERPGRHRSGERHLPLPEALPHPRQGNGYRLTPVQRGLHPLRHRAVGDDAQRQAIHRLGPAQVEPHRR